MLAEKGYGICMTSINFKFGSELLQILPYLYRSWHLKLHFIEQALFCKGQVDEGNKENYNRAASLLVMDAYVNGVADQRRISHLAVWNWFRICRFKYASESSPHRYAVLP